MALAMIANVEVVTLLCGVYGYVFGPIGVVAISLFVVIETLIWGFNTWVLSYIIHWPMVCIIFWLLGKLKVKNVFILTATAVLLTAWFGVLTSLVDVGLFTGFYQDFWKRFAIYYMRGIVFYIVHVVCNVFTFLFLFKPLSVALNNLKSKFFGEKLVQPPNNPCTYGKAQSDSTPATDDQLSNIPTDDTYSGQQDNL